MISQTSEYALRAVMYLALCESKPRTTAEIASRTMIPAGYLSKVLRTLSQAGLMEARRGIGGGFKLGKEPREISIHDVIIAVDAGVSRIETCPLGSFEHESLCAMHRMLDDANAYVETKFRKTTIQDVVDAAGVSHPLCDPTQRPITPTFGGGLSDTDAPSGS